MKGHLLGQVIPWPSLHLIFQKYDSKLLQYVIEIQIYLSNSHMTAPLPKPSKQAQSYFESNTLQLSSLAPSSHFHHGLRNQWQLQC